MAKQPSPKVVEWIDTLADERVYLSAITIGELKKGIEKLPASQRKELLGEWLMEELLTRFAGKILPIDPAVMLTWRQLTATLEQATCLKTPQKMKISTVRLSSRRSRQAHEERKGARKVFLCVTLRPSRPPRWLFTHQRGHKLPAIDSLIAALALHGGFTLVTRNEADFRDTGVTVFNPWS